MEDSVIELKNIGERLTSIVSVEHYALGLLKMLETHTQKEIANYVSVSPAKLSPIIQILSDIYMYKQCVIVKYVVTYTNPVKYYLVEMTQDNYDKVTDEHIDIFRFNLDTWNKVKSDLGLVKDIDPTFKYILVAKIPQITIDALHNLEYKYKA